MHTPVINSFSCLSTMQEERLYRSHTQSSAKKMNTHKIWWVKRKSQSTQSSRQHTCAKISQSTWSWMHYLPVRCCHSASTSTIRARLVRKKVTRFQKKFPAPAKGISSSSPHFGVSRICDVRCNNELPHVRTLSWTVITACCCRLWMIDC